MIVEKLTDNEFTSGGIITVLWLCHHCLEILILLTCCNLAGHCNWIQKPHLSFFSPPFCLVSSLSHLLFHVPCRCSMCEWLSLRRQSSPFCTLWFFHVLPCMVAYTLEHSHCDRKMAKIDVDMRSIRNRYKARVVIRINIDDKHGCWLVAIYLKFHFHLVTSASVAR